MPLVPHEPRYTPVRIRLHSLTPSLGPIDVVTPSPLALPSSTRPVKHRLLAHWRCQIRNTKNIIAEIVFSFKGMPTDPGRDPGGPRELPLRDGRSNVTRTAANPLGLTASASFFRQTHSRGPTLNAADPTQTYRRSIARRTCIEFLV